MESLLKNPRILLKLGKNWSINDIEELDIRLMDVGWDASGGKSSNVWGNVIIPKELISYAEEYVRAKNRRPSIWTCYDDVLYSRDAEGNWHVTPENLPSRISATFKFSDNRFSPIVENMAMRIAASLDLPTSYNFLVKYTPELHEEITSHINPSYRAERFINEYGVVSIDMLKGYTTTTPKEIEKIDHYTVANQQKQEMEEFERVIPSIDNINGDQLVSFLDSEKYIHNGAIPFSEDDGLVENWMKIVKCFASTYMEKMTDEERTNALAKINSRIARSTLLRTFIGDCDFTAYNSGYIYNAQQKKMDYAPNFDYGESFNALRVAKLEKLRLDPNNLKFILEHQPNFLDAKNKEKLKTITEIAQTYESGTSEENLRFISTHFEADILEFLGNLNQAIEDNVISDIIYSYTQPNEYGDRLITVEEAEMFDEYITKRANWLTFVIVRNILEAESEKFLGKIIREKIGKHATNFPLEKLKGFVDKKFESLPMEEKEKIKAFPDHLSKAEYIKASYPQDFASFTKNVNTVIDNFWRKSLAPNFIEYFGFEEQSHIMSKDEVKGEFIKQFIDKTFDSAYKSEKAPLSAQKTQNKGKA